MSDKKLPNIPELLPPKISYSKIYKELGMAHRAVGELQGVLINIPNKSLFINPLITKEAIASTKIEGTQATLEEVYEYEVGETKNNGPGKEDVQEVINYKKALEYAIKKIEEDEQPIAENFIKEIHSILLDSTRGEKRDRGHLRRSQVYIAKSKVSIEKANYIPPPPTELPRLLSNWENYINTNEGEDPLVLAAVSHYQFEAIHPFSDGNGRMGRILIPIILFKRGYLDYPYLYLSEYFEERRDEYIDRLQRMDEDGIWEDWVIFFLKSIIAQATETRLKANKLITLYKDTKKKVTSMNSAYADRLLDIVFTKPIISFKIIKNLLPVKSNQTIYNLLDKFQQANILVEIGEGKRGKAYGFVDLMMIQGSQRTMENDVFLELGNGDDMMNVDQIFAEGEAYFQNAVQERNILLPEHGSWEVSLIIQGENENDFSANQTFLNTIYSTDIHYTGWPIWLDTRDFRLEDCRPYVLDGAWQALIIMLNKISMRDHLEFWRMYPQGRFYSRRALKDDIFGADIQPEILTKLDFYFPIADVAEAIAVGKNFANNMGYLSTSTILEFGFKWTKLKGRELTSWVNPRRHLRPRRPSQQDEIITKINVPLDTPMNSISSFVNSATKPLFEIFDGAEIGQSIIEEFTNKIINRKLT